MELFNLGLDAKLSFPGSELERLWPFLDNIYVHYRKNAAKTHTTSYYRFRLWRKDPIQVRVTPEQSQANSSIKGSCCLPLQDQSYHQVRRGLNYSR
jgi:hypothetical protein